MKSLGKNENPAEAGQGQQININLSEQPDIKCATCDGIYFEQVMQFKKVSKVLTAQPQDQIAPIQVFTCASCGTPCQELMPDM